MKPIDAVLEAIEAAREELADLALTLGNTYGPVGAERATAEVVDGWWRAQGIRSRLVEIIDQRANVVAEIGGNGGRTLDLQRPPRHRGVRTGLRAVDGGAGPQRDGRVARGRPAVRPHHPQRPRVHGGVHDRRSGARRARRTAARDGSSSRPSPARPDRRRSTSTRVCATRARGSGRAISSQHGVVGDFALVAETTDFASCWYNCGAAYLQGHRARVEHVHAAAGAARRPRRPSQCHRQGGSGRPGHRSVGYRPRGVTSPADAVRRGAPEGPGRGDPRRHTVAAQPFFAVLRPLRRCAIVAGRAGGTGHREPALAPLRRRESTPKSTS